MNFFLFLLGFKVSSKCCAVLPRWSESKLAEQNYTLYIFIYIFHCICYTIAKHLASGSLQRQFTCHSTRRRMWEVCTVCCRGSATVERHSSWYQYNPNSRKNPSFQTAPPLPALFLKRALFLLIPGVFCTVCVCTIKFFHVTSSKGQTTCGVKEYTVRVSVYFPN